MKRLVLPLALCVALLAAPRADATDGAHRYGRIHPYPTGFAHDFCYIDAPHRHDFAPFDPYLFHSVDGVYFFVGDPVAWGLDATRYAVHSFSGHHPVDLAFGGAYCYLDGPHHHRWTPNHPYLDGWAWDVRFWVWGGAFTATYYAYRNAYRSYYSHRYRPRYPSGISGKGYAPGAVVTGSSTLKRTTRAGPKVFVSGERVFVPAPGTPAAKTPRAAKSHHAGRRPVARTIPPPRKKTPSVRKARGSHALPAGGKAPPLRPMRPTPAPKAKAHPKR